MQNEAVLISIRPQWCEQIARKIKTIEVRKTKPKLQPPFKVFIYCTKVDLLIRMHGTDNRYYYAACSKENREKLKSIPHTDLSGKVIGEFICDSIMPMSVEYSDPEHRLANRDFPFTCLTDKQIIDYLGNGERGYGWHISELVIYDKPKRLAEFNINKSPQSWCYVKERVMQNE